MPCDRQRLVVGMIGTGGPRREVGQFVSEPQYQEIAGLHAQGWGERALRRQVAIVDRAVRLLGIIKGEVDFEDAAGTAQILRLRYGAAGLWATARITWGIGFLRQAVGRNACRQQTHAGGQSLRNAMSFNGARKTARTRTRNRHPRPRNLWLLEELKKLLKG
jgi:hypothetical protein